MSMPESQRKKCIDIMDKLFENKTALMFSKPIDPEKENSPIYKDVVKTPIDLGTIRNRLLNNQYRSVADWKSDVNLVWSNSMSVYENHSILYYIAKHLKDEFRKLTLYFSDSPSTDWDSYLQALYQEANSIIKTIITTPGNSALPSIQPFTNSHQKNKNSAERRSRAPAEHKDSCSFSRDELMKLTHDINSLEDEDKLNQITDMLLENEPNIKDNGEEIEVDLTTLKNPTLHKLRKLVNRLMN